MPNKIKIYFAAPLFTTFERLGNHMLAAALMAEASRVGLPMLDIQLPQDYKVHSKFNNKKAFRDVYNHCVKAVEWCDIVVACLDGPDADSGTCFEIGYAKALKKPVIAWRSDFREQQEKGVNLMLSQSADAFIRRPGFDEDIDALAKEIIQKLKRVLKTKGE